MKLRPPETLNNVYRDMRDRRLLWIALALVLAIVAVPLLLGADSVDQGADSVDSTSSAAATAPLDGAEQIDPVVLTEVPGLRDYRERLDRYRSKNPFKQQLTALPPDAAESEGSGDGSGSLPTESSPSTDSSPTEITDPSTSVDGGSPATPDVPVAPDVPPEGEPADPDAADPDGVITYRLDIRVGPVGDTRVERGVKSLDMLPDRRNAVVQYLEGNAKGTTAAFNVSPDAVAEEGDAKCSPSRKRCRFLLMEVGDDQMLRYEPDGLLYRLELLAITRHVEPLGKRQAEPKSDPEDEAESGFDGPGWTAEPPAE